MISSQSFFKQKIKFKNIEIPRTSFLNNIISNLNTLHIGCADWPIYNPNDNLHIRLYKENNLVEGYDVDENTVNKMLELPELKNAKIYTTLPSKKYDYILAPETIEHVDNVGEFLLSLYNLAHSNTNIFISAPNAFCNEHISRNKYISQTEFIEIVHPDHNCWFSLYTLPNYIRKIYKKNNIPIEIIEIGMLENQTMVYTIIKFLFS